MIEPASMGISVIIPAYNASRYLHSAIGSVLAQTHQAAEIIVVDDGSSDDTASIAAGFSGIRVLSMSHQGAGAARNRGVAAATGRYLAFLDADDLWLPTKLEEQVAVFTEHPQLKGVFGRVRQFVSPELGAELRGRYKVGSDPAPGYVAGCLLIERGAFLSVGNFDESLAGGEFIEWMVRARRGGVAMTMLESTVLLRRIHGANSVLSNIATIQDAYLKLARTIHKGADNERHINPESVLPAQK